MDNLYFDLKRLKYLGAGAIIGRAVRVRRPEECVIGDGSIVDDFVYISCSIEVGKYCHIASHVSISGGAGHFKMGDYSTVSNHCSIHCASSDYSSVSLDLPSVPLDGRFGGSIGEVIVGDYVTVGAHSCILPGARLPSGSAFGAYSLVKSIDYLPFGLYVGIPAKFRKMRSVPDDAPEALRELAANLKSAGSGSAYD
jgi:acetyltransferase-like isoleucine patch superfamily enzyme